MLLPFIMLLWAPPASAQGQNSVIVTHWNGPIQQWEIGAFGKVLGGNPLPYQWDDVATYPFLDQGFHNHWPDVDQYPEENYSSLLVPSELKNAYDAFIDTRTGLAVEHINFGTTVGGHD